MAKFEFEIIERLGSFSDPDDKWQKELNIVRWNENAARYDLRPWNESHEKMGKGITLSLYETRKLKELLNSIEI